MGTEEIPHINNVNDTLKILLEEIRLMHGTMRNIVEKLDSISNNTNRI